VVIERVNIVITMAGGGERFKQAGYSAPKFAIEARGRTLFHWSLVSLQKFFAIAEQFVFVARREHSPEEFIRREASALGIPSASVVLLNAPTDGQATSALLGAEGINDRSIPLMIYNIDTHVKPGALTPAGVKGTGWIPCFDGEGDHWSFAACDEAGRVREVAEKRRISRHATVGLYGFASLDVFQTLYEQHFGAGTDCGTAERYVAPMYNTLIRNGGSVWIEEVEASAVHPLGTPWEVERFRQ
jgi:choline kinase